MKDEIMEKAVRAKFTQHRSLQKKLISTGNKRLVEDSPKDYYWGIGKKRTGKNMLGKILMKIRAEIRGESEELTPKSVTKSKRHKIGEDGYVAIKIVYPRRTQ